VAGVTLPWIILVAAIAATVFVVAISREFPSKEGGQEWVVRRDGEIVERICGRMPDGVETSSFPHAVTIRWRYAGEMPEKGDMARIDRLEDRLDALDDGKQGYLMFVTTGAGQRTWTWFVREGPPFIDEVRRRVAVEDATLIAFASSDDPRWDAYTRMRRAVL
jgi:Family of unknown function (DUF695)